MTTEDIVTATDYEDWRTSPDLMSLDDKLDVLFGPADEATQAWIDAATVMRNDRAARRAALRELDAQTSLLNVGTADCVRRLRRIERVAGVR